MSTTSTPNDDKQSKHIDNSVNVSTNTSSSDVVHPVGTTTPTEDTSIVDDVSSEPLSPLSTIRSDDYRPGGKYEGLFGWSPSSSSSTESTPSSTSTPLCKPYGDQFGRYSVSMCDRHYDCTDTPFHSPSHTFILPLVEESPPKKRVRRRLFPHDNSTPYPRHQNILGT